jgi:hypothetical protein
MTSRIEELEDALATCQARLSSESHPLLQGDLLKIKTTKDQATVPETPSSELLSETLGTLTIGENGNLKYFGRSGGSEVCTSLSKGSYVPTAPHHRVC